MKFRYLATNIEPPFFSIPNVVLLLFHHTKIDFNCSLGLSRISGCLDIRCRNIQFSRIPVLFCSGKFVTGNSGQNSGFRVRPGIRNSEFRPESPVTNFPEQNRTGIPENSIFRRRISGSPDIRLNPSLNN